MTSQRRNSEKSRAGNARARNRSKVSKTPKPVNSTVTSKPNETVSTYSPLRGVLSGLAMTALFVGLALLTMLSSERNRQREALEHVSQNVKSMVATTQSELARITNLSATLIRDNKSKRAKGSRVISRGIFQSQITPITKDAPFIKSAVFMPRIVKQDEAIFEAASHAKGLAQYQPPLSLNGDKEARPSYFPVRFVDWNVQGSGSDLNTSLSLFPKSVIAGEEILSTIVKTIERGGIRTSNVFIHPQQAGEFGSLEGEKKDTQSLSGPANHVFWLMSAVRDDIAPKSNQPSSTVHSVKSVAGIYGFEISLDQLIDTANLPAGTIIDISLPGPSSSVIKRYSAAGNWSSSLLEYTGLQPFSVEQPLGFPDQDLVVSISINPQINLFESNVLVFALLAGVATMGLSVVMSTRMSRITRKLYADRQDFERRVDEQNKILAASDAQFSHLIESTNVVAWAADLRTKRFTYVGPQIEGLTGYPVSTWYSHGFWVHHVHPDDRDRVLYELDELKEDTFAVREYRVRRSDGSVIWVRNSITATGGDKSTAASRLNKTPHLIQGFLIDITDQKRAQATLHRAKETAEQANRTKSEFLANMSHELRTPLNSIIGFAEIMDGQLLGPLGNSKYNDYAKNIQTSGRHLLELINDILDLSKIESGRFELQETEVDLLALLKSSFSLLQERAKIAGVHFSLSAEPSLPDLYGDGRRIKQILFNLLSNAIKFTNPGGAVALEAKVIKGKGLALTVRDNGIGISAENIPLAMEKFSQIDSSLARQHDGSGLGLPIARSLAELHGGKLVLDTKLDQGTAVTILLPETRLLAANDASVEPPSKPDVYDDGEPVAVRDVA